MCVCNIRWVFGWSCPELKVGIFLDSVNVISAKLCLMVGHHLLSFTSSYHCPWPWPYFKVTVVYNSQNWMLVFLRCCFYLKWERLFLLLCVCEVHLGLCESLSMLCMKWWLYWLSMLWKVMLKWYSIAITVLVIWLLPLMKYFCWIF